MKWADTIFFFRPTRPFYPQPYALMFSSSLMFSSYKSSVMFRFPRSGPNFLVSPTSDTFQTRSFQCRPPNSRCLIKFVTADSRRVQRGSLPFYLGISRPFERPFPALGRVIGYTYLCAVRPMGFRQKPGGSNSARKPIWFAASVRCRICPFVREPWPYGRPCCMALYTRRRRSIFPGQSGSRLNTNFVARIRRRIIACGTDPVDGNYAILYV